MTTNTTSTASQAPAVSIDDEEFSHMLAQAAIFWMADPLRYALAREKLVAHIDAKLAQARQEGYCEGSTVGFKGGEYFYRERATAAEAKLEAIRMAIDGLARFYTVGDEPVEYPDSDFLMYKDVSSLFQPQPQADESGLPG